MKWFHNLKTLQKLMFGFALVCAISAGIGYLGVSNMDTINQMLNRLYQRDMLGLSAVKEAHLSVVHIGRSLRAVILVTNLAERQRHASVVEKRFSILDTELTNAAKTMITDEGRALVAEIREVIPAYRVEVMEALRFALAGDTNKASELTVIASVRGEKLHEATARLALLKEKLGKQTYEESDAIYTRSMKMMVAAIVLSVLLGLTLGYRISISISRPLADAVEVLTAVAGGDLTKTLKVETKDEVGQMAEALNLAVAGMREAMKEVRASALSVSASSEELAASAEELSGGAQEQAASIEETAASLEQMTASVRQNADSSREANQLAAGSRGTAENGGQVVAAAVQAMAEINTSSKRIADIITAIDEIAFQTNLLALNAAVEAARAGEQGRGFAVVAGEVRNLAQRSATAAKEIKTLIQDSVRKVDNGSELVNQSGKTLDAIVSSVKRVTDIVGEISAASQEQANGIEQVNKAMTQMDQVTQLNASQTEELTTTAQALAAQAEQLQAMVARFKLEQDHEKRQVVSQQYEARSKAQPTRSLAAPRSNAVAQRSNGRLQHVIPGANGKAGMDASGGFEEFS